MKSFYVFRRFLFTFDELGLGFRERDLHVVDERFG